MTSDEYRHMMAAAQGHPPEHMRIEHDAVFVRRVSSVPCRAKQFAAADARHFFRMVEYFEACDAELVLLSEMAKRGENGLPLESIMERRETYWQRIGAYIKALGPNDNPIGLQSTEVAA